MDTGADAAKSAKTAAQMVQDHPHANTFLRMKSPSTLTSFSGQKDKDAVDSPPRYTRHHSLQGILHRSKKEKAQKAQVKRRGSGFTSVHIDDYGDTKDVGPVREKLKSRMNFFLGQMQNVKRKSRTSSYFFGDKSAEKSEQFGHLVDLKTLVEQKETDGNGKDNNGDGEDHGQFHGQELVEQTITQTESHRLLFLKPWVFNPGHTYRQTWDLVAVMCALVYTSLRVPYAIAFDIDEFAQLDVWFWFNRLVDLVFIMDMVVIFLTAQKDGRKMITSHSYIALKYIKTWFMFDFIASIPLDVIIWISLGAQLGDGAAKNGDYARSAKLIRAIKIFRILRILRLVKMKRIVITLEIFFGLNFSVMAIGKFAIAIGLLSHLLACGSLGISPKNDADSWIASEPGSEQNQYIAAMYWTFTTMTTIGYGDIQGETTIERIYSIAAQLIGAVTFTYGVTRIVHIVTSMGRSQRNLTNQLENVQEWARYHDFPQEMVNDIKKYLHYKASRSYFNEKTVLSGLSLTLRRTVLKHIYESALKKVELFNHCSEDFVAEIMLKMRSEFASPYSIIISQGSIGQSMYIIRKGFTAVYRGFTRRDIQSAVILGAGQAFGEISLLADNITRTASVVALEWVDMAVITRDDFESLISDFPREQLKMAKYAESKIKSWKLIRQREDEKKREQNLKKKRSFSKGSSGDSTPLARAATKSIDDDIKRFAQGAAAKELNIPVPQSLLTDQLRSANTSQMSCEIVDNTTPVMSVSQKEKEPRPQLGQEVDCSKFSHDQVLQRLNMLGGEIGKLRRSWTSHLAAEEKINKEINLKRKQRKNKDSKGIGNDDITDTDDSKRKPGLNRHLTLPSHTDVLTTDEAKGIKKEKDVISETYVSTGSESISVKLRRQNSSLMEGISLENVLMTDLFAQTEDKQSEETDSETIACLTVIDDVSIIPSSVDTDQIDAR